MRSNFFIKSLKIVSFLGILLLAGLFKSEDVSARAWVSCGSNASTQRACNLYNGYIARGAMWLNTIAGSSDGADSDTIIIDNDNASSLQEFTLYLHGAIRGSSGGANCIRLSSYDPGVGTCRIAPSNDASIKNISGSYLGRNAFPGSLSYSYLSVTMDLSEVRKWSSYREGEYVVYQKTLYGFRCYAGSTASDACYADPIYVKIRIKDEPIEIDLTPSASVSGTEYIGETRTSSFSFNTKIDKKTNNNATNEVVNNLIRNQDIYFYIEKTRSKDEDWGARSVEASSPSAAVTAVCNNFGSVVCQPDISSIPNDENYVGRKLCGVRATNQGRYKYDKDGNRYVEWETEWKVSGAACVPIAKKMLVGIAGSNTYLAGGADTIVSRKSGGLVYGSWTEFMAITGSGGGITGGKNHGLSSGSGLAVGRRLTDLSDTSNWSPLTTANSDATSEKIPAAEISASSGFLEQLKNSVLSKGTKTGSSGGADIYEGDGVRIYKSSGDIKIDRDIRNSDKNLQIIIYSANGSVSIGENVGQIDAWIIAPSGTVNTCYNYSIEGNGSDADKCTKQLKVNGLIYAASLKLNRTYGGTNESPAELINLTPASYVWAYNQITTNYVNPTTVYTRELAPRT